MARQGRLKLRARDDEDLRVVSACLQDALVPLADVAFLKPEKRFVLVLNRFMWESAPEGAEMSKALEAVAEAPAEGDGDARFEDAEGPAPPYQRVNAGLTFDKVEAVRFRGFDVRKRDEILSLLAIAPEEDAITLAFSGGAAIQLKVAGIQCHLEDIGEPWPTRWRPQHEDEGAESAEASEG